MTCTIYRIHQSRQIKQEIAPMYAMVPAVHSLPTNLPASVVRSFTACPLAGPQVQVSQSSCQTTARP